MLLRKPIFIHVISYLPQRAWLLKLLAVELHAGYGSSSTHQEACQTILAHLFGRDHIEETDRTLSLPFMVQNITEHAGTRTISKSKVLLVTFVFVMFYCHPSLVKSYMHIVFACIV